MSVCVREFEPPMHGQGIVHFVASPALRVQVEDVEVMSSRDGSDLVPMGVAGRRLRYVCERISEDPNEMYVL